MVQRVREGVGLRAVAREFRVTLSTVQRWVARAGDGPLDQVDWTDRPSGCRASPQRTRASLEERVLKLRKSLQTKSDLGEYGAEAIHRELERRQVKQRPSVRTIGRVLERHGALDGRRRLRHTSPPRGWYLPKVAAGELELDSLDAIEDLVIRGGHDVNVLTGISLHGGLSAAWPAEQMTAKITVECLLEHWREFGLPGYAKFDNGTVFQGNHAWPDTFGRVTRTCLSLGVIPVFAPPLSRGFQADIETFHGRWQDSVWSRFTFRSREQLVAQSRKFIQAHHDRHAVRIEDAPGATNLPEELASQPATTPERNRDLRARDQQHRCGHGARTHVRTELPAVPPPDSRRRQPDGPRNPVPCAATKGSAQPSPPRQTSLRSTHETLSRVTSEH